MTFFVLGSHPALSVAEIANVLGVEINHSQYSKEILLLDEIGTSPEALQGRLGGTIKIGDIVGEVNPPSPGFGGARKIDKEEVADLFVSLLAHPSPLPLSLRERGEEERGNRVVFGISTYSLDAHRDLSTEVKQIGMTIKTKLKEEGRTARFVSTKTAALPSAAVTGEKLLENGAEFVIIVSKEKIYLGQTRIVQDFQSWSARDYGRPRRDAKSGMLPPKLARMMINLSGAKTSAALLDPFCGSGTVLMEAALMEFTNLIGSDISEKAIKDTTINLDWLNQNEEVDTSGIRLFNKPIETLAGDLKEKVEVIVGETYLGPPLSGRETPFRQKQIMDELLERTASGLAALLQLLKKGGTVVLALPAFCARHSPATAGQNGKNIQYLPTKKLAEAVGLQIVPFTGEPNEVSPNGGLLYVRENQKVGREIVKMVLK
ncbi:MAG: DNA methyltransferase [Patescibacteria group bacterium]